MNSLKLVSVNKAYESERGRIEVLKDFHLEVKEGEFLALIGPSGCGKSTLLRLMAGLEPPDGGSILFKGRPLETKTDGKIVLIFQEPLLFPWLTVEGNIGFGLKLKGLGQKEIKDIVLGLLKKVGLEGFEKFYPHELSGGMRHRVALARALAVNPDVLLMDEPFASVDAITREALQEKLLEIWEDARKTVVFVTHSLKEALLLADRICVLTPRPATVKALYELKVPRPRNGKHSFLAEWEWELRRELLS